MNQQKKKKKLKHCFIFFLLSIVFKLIRVPLMHCSWKTAQKLQQKEGRSMEFVSERRFVLKNKDFGRNGMRNWRFRIKERRRRRRRMKRSEKILFQPDLISEVAPLSVSVNIVSFFPFLFLFFFFLKQIIILGLYILSLSENKVVYDSRIVINNLIYIYIIIKSKKKFKKK